LACNPADNDSILAKATGNWQLATGNWQLATGNWQLATKLKDSLENKEISHAAQYHRPPN
jgi:hypothetical protein